MARQTVKVEGLRELKNALEDLPKATRTNVLKRALMKAGDPIESAAERLVPVDTGHLQRTIVVGSKLSKRQKRLNRKQSKVEVYIGPGPLSSAIQSEFGNVHQGPQPFMRPAWDGNRMAALNSIKADIWNEIQKAQKRLAAKAAKLLAKAQ